MNFNLLILGAILILAMFGVGESIYKRFGISKIFILVCLSLMIIGLYVPNLQIKDISLSISGFILPAIFCLLICFKIRSFSFFVNLLFMGFICLLLRLVYVDLEFVPIVVQISCMSALGCLLAFITKEAFSMFVSAFAGFVVGNLIFELIKYGNIAFWGTGTGLSFVLISLIAGSGVLFLKMKIKEQMIRSKTL